MKSIRNIKTAAITFFVSAFMLIPAATVVVSPAVSAELKDGLCQGADLSLGSIDNKECEEQAKNSNPEGRLNGLITSIINILSVIVGIVAVIMIIVGGFKFITSGGDSGKITSARQTVIYALIGLVIVALAQFIVRFVLSKV
jgi:hypothetical protein